MNIEVVNEASPFDFVKALLTNKKQYAKFTNKLKEKSFFMAQRFLSKQYPVQINTGNLNGIDRVAILDLYHFKLCNDGGMIPRWLYTKGGDDLNISKEEKLFREIKSNTEICIQLLENFDIELKSLDDLIHRNYVYVEAEFNKLKDAHEGKVKKKRKSKKL